MAGIKALRRLQFGHEGTAGTAVSASGIWRGTGTIESLDKYVFPVEDVGYLMGADRVYAQQRESQLALDNIEATFEQVQYLLESGIRKVQTGAANSTGSGYIYTYTLPTTQVPVLQTYTFEGGDDQQAEGFAYGFCETFKLTGKGGEALKMSGTLHGRTTAPITYTPSLSLPDIEEIVFASGSLYIDDIGSAFGATLKSNILMEMDLTVKTGRVPMYAAAGDPNALYFGALGFDGKNFSFELKMTLLHDGTAVAEKAAWKAKTERKVRCKFLGSTLGTAGDYTNKTLIIDLLGRYSKTEKLGELNGNDILAFTLMGRFSPTAGTAGEIVVANLLASLP